MPFFRIPRRGSRSSYLLLCALDRGGLGAQVLAKVALRELRILRQRQIKALDLVNLENSTHRRRFAPLISAGIRLGYLVCVDLDGHLQSIPDETYDIIERVLAKQLFVEASRQGKPFETAEEILMHLLDGGFPAESYFKLQTASTYLADFHPVAFALIDLSAYRTLYLGKNQLKDELTYRFYASHPFLI